MQEYEVDSCTIFSTIVGSVAYGTNTSSSDIDIRGVAIPSDKTYYTGFLKNFEQFESPTEDKVIYDIRKAFKLLSDCNPNMLDLLYTEPRFFKKISTYWEKVLYHREKFLSKRARYSYTGYAFAQLKRIKTARSWLLHPPKAKPERTNFGLPERSELTKDDMGAFYWIMAHLLKDTIQYLNFSDSTKLELENANWIGMIQNKGLDNNSLHVIQKTTGASDSWMMMLQKEQAYSSAKREWDSYINWKNSRNKVRAESEEKFGYDTKHAAHLVRLMRMGYEILNDGKVITYRPDREELLAIRNGSWEYSKLEEYATDMESKIASLYETSMLPKEPDRIFLDNLCSDIVNSYLE